MPDILNGARICAILALAAGLAAFVFVVHRLARQPLEERADPGTGRALETAAPQPIAGQPFAFASNAECRPCHQDIWDECAGDQHSRAWFNEPLLTQDPRRTECNNCHAPEPILETGIEELAVIRTARFEEGVGCIECHRNGDHVEGPLPGAEAACNPVQNEAFTSSNICNACHAAHGSFAEWQASEWAEEGVTCQGCHMPLVERASSSDGPLRHVRSHRMRTQRDPALLREALTFGAALDGRALVVSLANTGAGHNVPGEIFNRELFVATRFASPDGRELAAYRESLKTVKREQRSTEQSTQLRAGESRTWKYAVPPGPGVVEVAVRYKDFFLAPDEAAQEVYAQTLEY